jgi:hypothetical protein
VVERFPKIAILDSHLWGEFSGPLRRKDAVSFRGNSPYKLYTYLGFL